MSPKLFNQLFEQIKRVITRPLALSDERGEIYKSFSDFGSQKRVEFRGEFGSKENLAHIPVTTKHALAVDGDENSQAIPIFLENKFLVVIVVKVPLEDTQTTQIIKSLAELIVQQFILTHKPKPDAVDLLLTRVAFRPQTLDPEELSEQMTALGFRLDLPRVAVTFELKGFWDNYLQTLGSPLGEKEGLIEAKKRDLNQSLTSFFTKNQDNLVGFIGKDTFLILKDLRDTEYVRFCQLLSRHYGEITAPLKNIHINEVTVGIGSVASTPSGLIRSAQEALQVLKIGQKIVGSNQTHRFDSLGVLPLLLMGNDQQKKEFSSKLYSSLEDPQLTETLEAFLATDLNLTQAATKLKIHRNTVIYRLDRIQEKLGKDPRVFADAVELHLASLFAKLFD
ncbi:MAG: helix-turn-helix domain-containing protein [Patescibacteria group bacterium]